MADSGEHDLMARGKAAVGLGVALLALAVAAPATTSATAKTKLASKSTDGTRSDSNSYDPSISDDGRYVAFESEATNANRGYDTNDKHDIFVHDRKTGETRRVSKRSNATEGNRGSYGGFISGDGRYVAFESDATNLVKNDTNGEEDVFWRGPLH